MQNNSVHVCAAAIELFQKGDVGVGESDFFMQSSAFEIDSMPEHRLTEINASIKKRHPKIRIVAEGVRLENRVGIKSRPLPRAKIVKFAPMKPCATMKAASGEGCSPSENAANEMGRPVELNAVKSGRPVENSAVKIRTGQKVCAAEVNASMKLRFSEVAVLIKACSLEILLRKDEPSEVVNLRFWRARHSRNQSLQRIFEIRIFLGNDTTMKDTEILLFVARMRARRFLAACVIEIDVATVHHVRFSRRKYATCCQC